jgi:peroxiredoxin
VTDVNESAKPDAELGIPPQENLINIIRAASYRGYWGPAFTSWYGRTAPDFTLTDIAGKQHKLSDYKGKNVLLVFWAAWCPPCRMEIPDLIELRKSIGEDKLGMLAISNEKPDLVKRFVEKQRINYTILLDTGNMPKPFGFMRVYGTSGVPCSFFIDSEGKIRLGTSGLITLNEIKAILQAI